MSKEEHRTAVVVKEAQRRFVFPFSSSIRMKNVIANGKREYAREMYMKIGNRIAITGLTMYKTPERKATRRLLVRSILTMK